MLSNLAVCTAFVNQEPAENRNMASWGNTLYSYDTVIAQHTKIDGHKAIILNATKYSPTTGRQKSMLAKALKGKGFLIVETESKLPFGVYDLTRHIASAPTNRYGGELRKVG